MANLVKYLKIQGKICDEIVSVKGNCPGWGRRENGGGGGRGFAAVVVFEGRCVEEFESSSACTFCVDTFCAGGS